MTRPKKYTTERHDLHVKISAAAHAQLAKYAQEHDLTQGEVIEQAWAALAAHLSKKRGG